MQRETFYNRHRKAFLNYVPFVFEKSKILCDHSKIGRTQFCLFSKQKAHN